jgi:hypothetical protein
MFGLTYMYELEKHHIPKWLLIALSLILLLLVISFWIIYTKADKPGWSVIIPVYGFIVLMEIIGRPWWWGFFMIIPFANIVFLIIILNQLSFSFGKDSGFTVGMFFLWFIFFPILAFGKSRYIGPEGVSQYELEFL